MLTCLCAGSGNAGHCDAEGLHRRQWVLKVKAEEQVLQGQYTDTEMDTDLQSSPDYAVIYRCLHHFVGMVTVNKDPQSLKMTKNSC